MVMSFAVRQPALFIMAMAQEGFFALSADEMLDMPVLTQSSHNALLNGTSAGAANRDSHAVMAAQAVKLVHVVGSEARAAFDLARS